MARKRILIDGRNLSLERGTGVATYARNLSYCLHDLHYQVEVLYGNRAAPSASSLMKEIAFFDANVGAPPRWLKRLRDMQDAFLAPFGHLARGVPVTGTVIIETFRSRLPYFDEIYNVPDLFAKAHGLFGLFNRLHTVKLASKPDLVHWTYPLPLKINGIPNIYTLHDLVPLRLPYTTLDHKRRYFKLVKKITRRADHIVTVSEASKTDIVNLLGADPDRVTNTYQAVSIPEKYRNKPADEVQREVEGTFGIEYKNYFLFWGSIEPKKNIGRMIEGYLASGVKPPLVILGAQAWKSEEELRLLYDDNIRSLVQVGNVTRVRHKVIQLAYAPFPLLVSLIKGAKATLFPSLYEGFGLPVLESMFLGTPVISSNTASVPEVAGDAAVLVNPYDTRAIAQAIRAVNDDEGLRASLVAKGYEQAKRFSEEAYRARLSTVYERFLGRSHADAAAGAATRGAGRAVDAADQAVASAPRPPGAARTTW
jgi:glycosyltransferase involved in cell wall biosynthesis